MFPLHDLLFERKYLGTCQKRLGLAVLVILFDQLGAVLEGQKEPVAVLSNPALRLLTPALPLGTFLCIPFIIRAIEFGKRSSIRYDKRLEVYQRALTVRENLCLIDGSFNALLAECDRTTRGYYESQTDRICYIPQ